MTLITILTLLVLLLLLTVFVSWGVLYIQFCNSAEEKWATRVISLLQKAKNSLLSEDRVLKRLASERQLKAVSIREDAFATHLSFHSVDELEAYPGIGQGTVGKLRSAGYFNLALLYQANIRVQGLGTKRLGDIEYAVRDLLGRARTAFAEPSSSQAQNLSEQLKKIEMEYDLLEARVDSRRRAIIEVINGLRETAEFAGTVTFWGWFRPLSNEALIPPEVIENRLPDLEARLREAEDKLVSNRAVKLDQYPEKTVSSKPIRERESFESVPQRLNQPTVVSVSAKEVGMSNESHLQSMELEIQFYMGVARGDGPITSKSHELILLHMHQCFSYDRALINRAESLLAHYESAAIDFDQCIRDIIRRFTVDHRAALIKFTTRILDISHKDSSRNLVYLYELAQRLKLSHTVLPPQQSPSLCLDPLRHGAVPPIGLESWKERSTPRNVPSTSLESWKERSTPPLATPISSPPLKEAKPDQTETEPTTHVASSLSANTSEQADNKSNASAEIPLDVPAFRNHPIHTPPEPKGESADEQIRVLEIPIGVPLSADLVKRQLNLLSERIAQDKVASMGTDFVKLAQTKRDTLHRAAESLLRAMGEKLENEPTRPPAQVMRQNPDLDEIFGGN